jgi:hypothetical protein
MSVTYAVLMFQYIYALIINNYALLNLLYSLTGLAQEILGHKTTIKMRQFLTLYLIYIYISMNLLNVINFLCSIFFVFIFINFSDVK